MRRPNRTIEVFDISLMAVVTKAMGAFLVLMVVFMQYYSSGPLGKQTAADLQKSIERTQTDLTEAMKKLVEKSNPEEIAKLLEEARRRLEEAKKLIDQLRRENDALNSQAQRLQNENEQLRKQVEDMQRMIDQEKVVFSGNIINWDCMDTRLRLGVVQKGMYINREKEGIKDPYILNFNPTLGSGDSNDETDFAQRYPSSKSEPGTGSHFNNATFRYAANSGSYMLIVVKQDLKPQRIRNFQGWALKQTARDCSVLLSLQTALPGKSTLSTNLTSRIVIPKDVYAYAVIDVTLDEKRAGFNVSEPSPATESWLNDQIANAAKVSP